jgi:hypothetical protein
VSARPTRPRLRHRRDERGYAAVLTAVFLSGLFFALSALSVDVARWYVEVERVQKAADAGALAGVTHMPQDFPRAQVTASEVSGRNGYPDGGTSSVSAVRAGRPSELKVTVSSTIRNTFGSFFGVDEITITRSAVADYHGPAPMGSPCNTFGNEPPAGNGPEASPRNPADGSALPAFGGFDGCTSEPDFWATIEGPETQKLHGDRYSTRPCGGTAVHECASSSHPDNKEYREDGYFWVVRVTEAAKNRPITLQLYDPGFVRTEQDCSGLDTRSAFEDTMNPLVTDGRLRYGDPATQANAAAIAAAKRFCSGDYYPNSGTPMTTSFVLRDPVDTLSPTDAPVHQGCVKQYKGVHKAPTPGQLRRAAADTYDAHLASYFHTWTDLCTFTPTAAGDYYLQVRSNVAFGGSTTANGNQPALISTDNPAASADKGDADPKGFGNNAFGIRAVTAAGSEQAVSVSGYARMPIFANAESATSTFNLIRIMPGAAGKSVSFNFYDVSDCAPKAGQTCAGTVRVMPPTDAGGSIVTTPFPGGCRTFGGSAPATGSTLTDCKAPVTRDRNNGKLQSMSIPIPADYTCNFASLGGCWYKVEVSYPGLVVQDITTWDANIVGDPVRLIE